MGCDGWMAALAFTEIKRNIKKKHIFNVGREYRALQRYVTYYIQGVQVPVSCIYYKTNWDKPPTYTGDLIPREYHFYALYTLHSHPHAKKYAI